MNDVAVLRLSINAFQTEFQITARLDPFESAITIPSACMQVFRRYYLKDQTLAVLDNQSRKLTAHSRKAIIGFFTEK